MADLLYCENCAAPNDINTMPGDCLKMPRLPNTFSGLADHNNVDWKCSKCGFWHLFEDEERPIQ